MPANAAFTTPETRYTKTGGVNIAYQVFGKGPTDLVVVPGWVSNLDAYWEEPTIARFYERLATFSRVITLDKRGTGLSDRVSEMPNLETRMDDVRAVMDAAQSRSATLFGSSEGGPMSALFAATYPDRTAGLILHASFPRLTTAPDFPMGWTPDLRQTLLDHVERNWGTALGIERRAPTLAKDERFRQWFARTLRSSASPSAALALMRMNSEIDIRGILPSIRVPTLLIHSVNDREIPIGMSRYMAEHIPGARLIELQGRDHIPVGDDSAQILNLIEEFMTGAIKGGEHDRVLATLLFTDIADATERAAAMGDRPWTDLLSRHHALVRRELSRFRGREIDTAGDGFLAAFDGPARAVQCARAIVKGVQALGLHVRAGVHTGECEVFGDKLSGISVHIGARIAGLAAADEVLVTGTVRDLVAGSSLTFADRGVRALKGVPGEWRIYAADH